MVAVRKLFVNPVVVLPGKPKEEPLPVPPKPVPRPLPLAGFTFGVGVEVRGKVEDGLVDKEPAPGTLPLVVVAVPKVPLVPSALPGVGEVPGLIAVTEGAAGTVEPTVVIVVDALPGEAGTVDGLLEAFGMMVPVLGGWLRYGATP